MVGALKKNAPDWPVFYHSLSLAGLTGSSQSEYVRSFVNVAQDEVGARCVVFNFRGRGGLTLKSPRTYCAANSEDLSEIIDHVREKYPQAPLIAVGVSLGRNK